MQAKNVMYAAVGAPVVAAKKVSSRLTDLKNRIGDEATGYTKVAEKAIDRWATEGEKVVSRVSDGKVVDEITSKVDLDQAKEQVTKLRDQLEDMLDTWRTSFRPEKAEVKTPVTKPATKKPAAKTAAKKPAAKTAAKASTAAKKPAAKTAAKAS